MLFKNGNFPSIASIRLWVKKQGGRACGATFFKANIIYTKIREYPDHFAFQIGIMHNSYNAAANFSSSNNGSSGFFNYLWKNTFNNQQEQQQQSSSR